MSSRCFGFSSRNLRLSNTIQSELKYIHFSHLFHLFRRFLGSRVDVSNHDEPALSICSTLWAYVVFFHILFYSVHPSQFRSAPGSGSWNLSRQDILCYIVFFSPLNMNKIYSLHCSISILDPIKLSKGYFVSS